jgi:hypothetical protein
MHVCLPHRRQVYSRPVSSTTASRVAPFSGRGRCERRYALVATVDHRDGPEGPGTHPGLRFCGHPSSIPRRAPANMPRTLTMATRAASPLSTGSPPAPTTCRSPPSPPLVHRYRCGGSVLPHHAVTTTTAFHLVKRFGGGPRSSPDARASWAPSTPGDPPRMKPCTIAGGAGIEVGLSFGAQSP